MSAQKNILFVNTQKKQCGVHQYGINLFNLLSEANDFKSDYCTINSVEDLDKIVEKYDIMICNYHWSTTTKAFSPSLDKRYHGGRMVCLFHDFYQIPLDKLTGNNFYDTFIIGDPTLDPRSGFSGFGRILTEFKGQPRKNQIPTFGSLGFNMSGKAFYKIVNLVQQQYDEAIININVPPNDAIQEETDKTIEATPQMQMLRSSITKPGIKLNLTHDFMDQEQMIQFLANNDLNIFPQDYVPSGYGISSSLDLALSCKRPFAISKCDMFRHVLKYNLPITIEDHSIKDILAGGSEILDPIYKDWGRNRVLNDIKQIIQTIGE